MKTLKIRIYPTKEQEVYLNAQIGACRFIYNKALWIKQHYYKYKGINLSIRGVIQGLLPIVKKSRKYSWLAAYETSAIRYPLIPLERAYKNFFEGRAGFPKYKKRAYSGSSHHTQSIQFLDNSIKIAKLKLVKAKVTRKIEGKLKHITIVKTASGKWFAMCLFDTPKQVINPIKHITKVIGIDLGLTYLATVYDGEKVIKIDNPHFFKRAQKNLRRKDKSLSRKVKGSKNWNKARVLRAKAYEKVAGARADYYHKLSRKLADENQAAILEDLAVKNMVKNRHLSRAISDASWSSLALMLKYKLEEQGKYLIKVGRYYPSSKTCSNCGHKIDKLGLFIREWDCPSCGAFLDRDGNAAVNIRREGILKLKAEGHSVSAHGGCVSRVSMSAVA